MAERVLPLSQLQRAAHAAHEVRANPVDRLPAWRAANAYIEPLEPERIGSALPLYVDLPPRRELVLEAIGSLGPKVAVWSDGPAAEDVHGEV